MDMVEILAVGIVVLLLLGWLLRKSGKTELNLMRIAVAVLALLVVGSIWWFAGGRHWVKDELDRVSGNAIVFPVPDNEESLPATVTADSRAVRVCNIGVVGWKAGMVQINDKYVANLAPVQPGKCSEIALDSFSVKNWKRVPAGLPPVYKVQIYVSDPTLLYGQFPILSSQFERAVAEPIRQDCLPAALSRPVMDWRQVPLPDTGTVISPQVRYSVAEDGTVSDVAVTQTGGSKAIDDAVRSLVSHWKYQTAPGCGRREVAAQIEIDPDAMKGRRR